MGTVAKTIRNALQETEGRVLDSDIFFEEINLNDSQRSAAERELSRLNKTNEISRLTNGVYAKKEISRITKKEKIVSEREIVSYYTKNNSGFTVGYDLYNRNNISTQISKKKTIVSSLLKKDKRTVKSVTVKKSNVRISKDIRMVIETLEIIENSDKIQDFNEIGFLNYMKNFVNYYDRSAVIETLNNFNYKKQTIYNLTKIMKLLGKDSDLEMLLNKTSDYKENKAYEAVSSR